MRIGISGKSGSGKDEIATWFRGHGFVQSNFKDALVAEVLKYFAGTLKSLGVDTNLHEWWHNPQAREILKDWGMFRRDQDPEYWVMKWFWATPMNENVVIADVRFENEARVIKALRGKIIRVIRPTDDNDNSHPSEREMENIVPDFVIYNDGTLSDLRMKLLKIYDGLREDNVYQSKK